MSDFVIELPGLPAGASRVRLESEPHGVGLSDDEWRGPIQGAFTVEKSGDRVSVRGELLATAALECVRCLRSYGQPLTVPLELYAERAGTGRHIDEVELERDDHMKFHDGRRLDLREDVREALLIEIPIAPHCREECPGLCATCGADLNQGPCGCGLQVAGALSDNQSRKLED